MTLLRGRKGRTDLTAASLDGYNWAIIAGEICAAACSKAQAFRVSPAFSVPFQGDSLQSCFVENRRR
jgi:hypothetical protein